MNTLWFPFFLVLGLSSFVGCAFGADEKPATKDLVTPKMTMEEPGGFDRSRRNTKAQKSITHFTFRRVGSRVENIRSLLITLGTNFRLGRGSLLMTILMGRGSGVIAESDRDSPLKRLARLKGKPVLVCGQNASAVRDGYLIDHIDLADFTFLDGRQ